MDAPGNTFASVCAPMRAAETTAMHAHLTAIFVSLRNAR